MDGELRTGAGGSLEEDEVEEVEEVDEANDDDAGGGGGGFELPPLAAPAAARIPALRYCVDRSEPLAATWGPERRAGRVRGEDDEED